ncbi:MAG: DUF2975 domain-containing protein, partial [Bacteroidota bacterium]
VGLLIEVVTKLVASAYILFNPQGILGFDNNEFLLDLRQNSIFHYCIVVFNSTILTTLKAYASYLVVQLLTKINLKSPFNLEIALLLEKLSYYILSIWIVDVVVNKYSEFLGSKFHLEISTSSLEYIFLGGVIFIIAQIFKRGIEIQTENELTV